MLFVNFSTSRILPFSTGKAMEAKGCPRELGLHETGFPGINKLTSGEEGRGII